jgi:acyl dehydratase
MARTSSPPVATKHVLQQGAVLAALGRTALLALKQQRTPKGSASSFVVPGPEIVIERPPLSRDLIDAYVRHLGSDPKSYRGVVPPHLFPQWTFPALARTLEGLPYPIMRVVNGGCSVQVLAPIPDNEPILVRARLSSIEDDGSRAVLKQTVTTGTRSAPEALKIEFTAVVPLSNGAEAKKADGGAKKEKARVPQLAHEVTREFLSADAGLSFAKLTGDFNPIHWLPPYAKASGFRNVILHGFGTLARSWEGLTRGVLGGDVHAITSFEARLTRPLVLPHEVGLYTVGHDLYVGDAPGGPAYLVGKYSAGEDRPVG